MDLYAQQTGRQFCEVRGWDAMVGGSPTNVAIAAGRLGLRSAIFTAVGNDLVGDWVLAALADERVDTSFVVRKDGPHTSLALRAQLPPDHPLAFYRHDPADIYLTARDAAVLPVDQARAVLVSADALARGTSPGACRAIIASAKQAGATVFLDLDLRETNWQDLGAYAAAVSPLIGEVDVVVGTEAEFSAALAIGGSDARLLDVVGARVGDDPTRVAVIKHGALGATVLRNGNAEQVPAFPVEEASSIGAGDSFAGGLIYARLAGSDWASAGAFASACGAITASRFGCSAGFPSLAEVESLLSGHPDAVGAR